MFADEDSRESILVHIYRASHQDFGVLWYCIKNSWRERFVGREGFHIVCLKVCTKRFAAGWYGVPVRGIIPRLLHVLWNTSRKEIRYINRNRRVMVSEVSSSGCGWRWVNMWIQWYHQPVHTHEGDGMIHMQAFLWLLWPFWLLWQHQWVICRLGWFISMFAALVTSSPSHLYSCINTGLVDSGSCQLLHTFHGKMSDVQN